MITHPATPTVQCLAFEPTLSAPAVIARPCARGKFVLVGGEKFYVRGVTYGPFRPDAQGSEYHQPSAVEFDFARMAASGLNAVRTYTVPPHWLLDTAQSHGLRVMVGLPWEQHVAFLNDRKRMRSIEARVRAGVRACAGHPAVLCYAIGNEIPAPIVRWHGPQRVERYLKRLYRAAKDEDPDGLVTYVNYPSTEYLQLPFLDLVCFNVYLEEQQPFETYLTHLHTLAGDRPLVISEIGLDSRRHGKEAQARSFDWQIRTTFAAGCAGAFVFAWTDEWFRGGLDIDDWDFGLTTRDQRPKASLAAVRKAFAQTPFAPDEAWPRISAVVCSFNGAHTLRDCLDGLRKLEYPNFEVIVVDDGSNDATAAIANESGFPLIRTENRGLSCARNTGVETATGEIVAFLDSDASPDPHWLTYLAAYFLNSRHAAIGGPNVPPAGDGLVAECVAAAPGGPVHVLISGSEAEHIPGCNLAIRKACVEAVGGFDPQFRVAGDDVDMCWRLQLRGWSLGFCPAAVVWHHPRASVRAYWHQQVGYGRAEALLERKWPERYNLAGHITWVGRLYQNCLSRRPGWGRGRIFYGTWGSALFQSVYRSETAGWWSIALMPEWYLVLIVLASLSALSILWKPLLLALPLLVLATGILFAQASLQANQALSIDPQRPWLDRLKFLGLTTFLHVLQPLARLCGRLRHGLTLWRRHGLPYFSFPHRWTSAIWSERWQMPEARLQFMEAALRAEGAVVLRGGDYDRWDLEVRAGTLGAARMRMASEEHDAGKQLVRFHVWPIAAYQALALALFFGALSVGGALGRAWAACALLSTVSILLALMMIRDCAAATAAVLHALRAAERENEKVNQTRPRGAVDDLDGGQPPHTGDNGRHGRSNRRGRSKAKNTRNSRTQKG